uniref:Uncharacterized protein n=1 Tax=Romanomermis culicivorax TaxID=13658 RepID=A0A915HSR3_ROMCU
MDPDLSSPINSPSETLHLKFGVQSLHKDNKELYERSLNFLLEYLREIRNEFWANKFLKVIDTHTLKILVEFRDSDGIVNFFSKELPNNNSPLIIDEDDIKSFCAAFSRLHELAIFYWFYISHGKSEAIKMWIRLCENESAMELPFLFGFLQRFNSSFDTLLPHLDWFFKTDSNETLGLLSCCKEDVNLICDYLKDNERLLLKFLEVLLIERKFE